MATPIRNIRTHPPLSILTAIASPCLFFALRPMFLSFTRSRVSFRQILSSLLRFFRANRLLGSCSRIWSRQAHFDLELLYQFTSLEFLCLIVNLDLLLIDVAHRHVHTSFVDGSRLFNLAHHLVVRLADAGTLELLHCIRDLLLPLRPAVVGDGIKCLLRL